jgi:hypothetical protein
MAIDCSSSRTACSAGVGGEISSSASPRVSRGGENAESNAPSTSASPGMPGICAALAPVAVFTSVSCSAATVGARRGGRAGGGGGRGGTGLRPSWRPRPA